MINTSQIIEPENGFPSLEKNGITYLKVIKSTDLLEGKGIKIQFIEDLDKQVAIIRINGEIYCLDNICPHRHADRIYEGIVKKDKMTIMCPLHGWTYSLHTGENINKIQGLKSLSKYDAFEENGDIYIEKPTFEIPMWRR